MANSKKYASLTNLQDFLDNLKSRFASLSHKHTIGDLTDYKVDSELSSTSTNPVQNKVLDAEFEAIATAMGALDSAIDGKANASHAHDDVYYTETEIDTKLAAKSDTTHKHDSDYDAKGSASAVQENLNAVSYALDGHTDNADIHVTTTNKSNWNTAYTHSQAAHARVDATKVADSTTNGNILINDTETNVYSHPNSGVIAGTYKSVTVNAQGHVTSGSNPTTLAGYGITDAETKTDAANKLAEAKTYADTAATKVKNDLLNGAGAAYDTLKELGDLIDDNQDAISALETVAAGKQDKISGVAGQVVGFDVNGNVIAQDNPQADWSVNDETNPAYVKNRTHWVSTENVIFIDNEVIEFSQEEAVGYVSSMIENDVVFVEGNTYLLTIDGTQYNCTAHILEGSGFTYIGNASLFDPSFADTLEPFVMLCYNEAEISTMSLAMAGLIMATTLEGSSHVISLSGDDVIYHKIDKKYLPYLVGQKDSGEGAEIFNDYSGANVASGGYSHAEGKNTLAEGWYSHAEGSGTSAIGTNSHAEGSGAVAQGVDSHAEGSETTASGYISHAEGYKTVASGDYGSHAEGTGTIAVGNYSHAEGWKTTANSESQHVQGEWNVVDTAGNEYTRGTYAHIVGNGTSDTKRSNAHTLDWSGNAWFAGNIKVGGSGQNSVDAKTLATQEYVNEQILSLIASMTSSVKVANITLLASKWEGSASPYSQVVTINGVTEYSQVDLKPNIEQLAIFHDKDLAFVTENEDGVVTVYALGDKPTNDYTIQVAITEVIV